jgi:Protein of unknown function (DUF3304)
MSESNPRYVAIKAIQLIFFLSICTIAGCKGQDMQPPTDTGIGSIVGVNYTSNGIQWFRVDGAYGASLGSYRGGGGYECCVKYPKTWSPDFKVTVKWERSDGLEPGGARFRIKAIEKTVNVEKYDFGGNVYVLFFPDDVVKIFVSRVGIGNSNFPTHPGYPEDQAKNKGTP